MEPSINIVTWNVGCRSAALLEKLVKFGPIDVLTLQEVALRQKEYFRERLEAMGLKHIHYNGRKNNSKKPYGNLIASRWPLEPVVVRYKKDVPRPEAIAQASIAVEGKSVTVITAHIPNGSKYGWGKIETFQVLNELVAQVKNQPGIVTGDFNEPEYLPLHNGRIVTFGQDYDGKSDYVFWPKWKGRTGEDWDKAVRWLFEEEKQHGFQHAYWGFYGRGAMAVSHIIRGQPRWFDHVFVSKDFRVEQCDYLHELRGRQLSDHSAVLTNLTFTSQS